MEYGLRRHLTSGMFIVTFVLILVLMEYGLRPMYVPAELGIKVGGLNPCFNGIWSATATNNSGFAINGKSAVLILVLMEYGLRQHLL